MNDKIKDIINGKITDLKKSITNSPYTLEEAREAEDFLVTHSRGDNEAKISEAVSRVSLIEDMEILEDFQEALTMDLMLVTSNYLVIGKNENLRTPGYLICKDGIYFKTKIAITREEQPGILDFPSEKYNVYSMHMIRD